MIGHEPTLWLNTYTAGPAPVWEIARAIIPYSEVSTIEEYLTILMSQIIQPPPARSPILQSSLGLPEAIDYLDVVWRLRFGRKLVSLPGAEKTVELASPCATSEEFRSRVSAIADLLSRIDVPDPDQGLETREGSLSRLDSFLQTRLDDVASSRVTDAIEILRAVTSIRASSQHHGAHPRGARGFDALGVPYPPNDWGEAWAHVQLATIDALNTIRDEVRSIEAD